eukprot:scaffold938_cov334-Pavlova_lutheri.AAC.40
MDGACDAASWLPLVPRFKASLGAAGCAGTVPNERLGLCPASDDGNVPASTPPMLPCTLCMPMLMLAMAGVVCMYPPDIPDPSGGMPSRP